MNTIQSMDHLQQLVRDGERDWAQYGEVKATYWDGLVLFNYTVGAHYTGRWNWFERVSRGLILDEHTGEVVARPFDKFFNVGEGGREPIGEIVEATEKVDGSLGILYRHKGQYRIATRGSFESEQALWATEWIQPLASKLDRWVSPYHTLLFEIVYPDNRIVVDYGGYEGLVLIGARERDRGTDLFYRGWEQYGMLGFDVPEHHMWASEKTLHQWNAQQDGTEHEGMVLRYLDGSRWKVKNPNYLKLHRVVTNASYGRVLRAMREGTLDQVREAVPDELLGEIDHWEAEIATEVEAMRERVEAAFGEAPQSSRKDFALWVNAHYAGLAPMLFQRLDGRDYTEKIYRQLANAHKEG